MEDDPAKPTAPSGDDLPERLLARLSLKIPGYRLTEEISRGGQAIVYRAVRESTGDIVAIKLPRDGLLSSEVARERIRREAVLLATVNHPGIVKLIDSGETPDGHEYIVMAYVAGQPLNRYIVDAITPLPPGERLDAMLRLFVKICRAVNEPHMKGIVHRDLCPANILVDHAGEPNILDFGLARSAFDRLVARSERDVSVAGQFLGRLKYASPEQTRGEPDAIDFRSDVYSLGVMLFEVMSGGRFPYDVDGDPARVIHAIKQSAPIAPSTLLDAAAVGRERLARLDAVLSRALAKDRGDRYPTASELGRDLESVLAGQSRIKGSNGVQRSSRVAAVTLAVVAIAAAVVVWRPGRTVQATSAPKSDAEARPLRADSLVTLRRIDLLKLTDPILDVRNHGLWKREGGVLVSDAPHGNELEFPYAAPAEYDYRVTFQCDSSPPENLQFFFPGRGRQVNWCVAMRDNCACGLDLIDGIDSAMNRTTRWAKHWTEAGKPQQFVAKVRKDHIDAYLNDAMIGHYETDYHEIGLREWVQWQRPDTAGLMFNMPGVKITAAELVEVTGQGKPTR